MSHAVRALAAILLGLALVACAGKPRVNPTTATATSGVPRPIDETQAAKINLQLGVGYLREGNLPIAKEKLDRAMKQDPHNPEVHGAMALLDERLGRDKDADKEYKTALDMAPSDPDMLNNYAVFLCSHSRADQGVRYFEQAASNPLYRTPWAAYTNAGVCLRGVHRDAEAATRFARALQSNPAYSEAVYQASDLDLMQHKYADARLRRGVPADQSGDARSAAAGLSYFSGAQRFGCAGALCGAAGAGVPDLESGARAGRRPCQPWLKRWKHPPSRRQARQVHS
jgi:type IV pilus assembly protein PilF